MYVYKLNKHDLNRPANESNTIKFRYMEINKNKNKKANNNNWFSLEIAGLQSRLSGTAQRLDYQSHSTTFRVLV